jgi:hypothetical protein
MRYVGSLQGAGKFDLLLVLFLVLGKGWTFGRMGLF